MSSCLRVGWCKEKLHSRRKKAVLKTRLAEADARPDAAHTEKTTYKDRLRDVVDRLSFDWGACSVALRTIVVN